MRLLLATLTVLASLSTSAVISTADAGTTCRRVGNTMYCSDTSGNRVTCRRVGNTTYCN